jgi:enamine deaminase RidA (YjgF/YER057c/UK114 family)
MMPLVARQLRRLHQRWPADGRLGAMASIRHLTSPALFPSPGYAHAVVSPPGATVWTAGGVPLDAGGNLVGAGDLTAQTEQVLANLTLALEACGASPSDVVRTTVYVVTVVRADLGVVWDAVRASPFAPAASTLLGVGLLGYDGQLVEIEATAVV